MKNIAYFLAILACAGLIAFGILQKINQHENVSQEAASPDLAGNTAASPATNEPAVPSVSVANNNPIAATPKANEPTKYQPTGLAAEAAPTETNKSQEFTVTTELLARLFLIDKYKPGTCFGAPVAIPPIAISSLLAAQPDLAAFLRTHYGLKADLEVYNKIKQLQGVTLAEQSSGNYHYNFTDGQCSYRAYYEGSISVIDNKVTEILGSKTEHTN